MSYCCSAWWPTGCLLLCKTSQCLIFQFISNNSCKTNVVFIYLLQSFTTSFCGWLCLKNNEWTLSYYNSTDNFFVFYSIIFSPSHIAINLNQVEYKNDCSTVLGQTNWLYHNPFQILWRQGKYTILANTGLLITHIFPDIVGLFRIYLFILASRLRNPPHGTCPSQKRINLSFLAQCRHENGNLLISK